MLNNFNTLPSDGISLVTLATYLCRSNALLNILLGASILSDVCWLVTGFLHPVNHSGLSQNEEFRNSTDKMNKWPNILCYPSPRIICTLDIAHTKKLPVEFTISEVYNLYYLMSAIGCRIVAFIFTSVVKIKPAIPRIIADTSYIQLNSSYKILVFPCVSSLEDFLHQLHR